MVEQSNENSGEVDKLVQAKFIENVHFHNQQNSTESGGEQSPRNSGRRAESEDDPKTRRRRRVTVGVVLACIGASVLVAVPFLPGLWNPMSRGADVPPASSSPPFGAVAPGKEGPSLGTSVPGNKKCMNRFAAAPARLDDNHLLVNIARTNDGHVVLSNAARNGWVTLLDSAANPPVLMLDAKCRLAAFVVDNKGSLLFNPDVESGEASEKWRSLGLADAEGTPAVTQDSEGRLVVVVRTAGGVLREVHQDASAGGWSAPQELDGPPVTDDPAVYQDPAGLVRVFAATQKRTVRDQIETHRASDQWRDATIIPGIVDSTPSVTENSRDGGRVELFSYRNDGSVQQNLETDQGANDWQGWKPMPSGPDGPFEGKPITVWDVNDRTVVFARDSHGALWEAWQTGSWTWSDWQPHGGHLREIVAATLSSDKTLVVHGIDNDRNLAADFQYRPVTRPWAGVQPKIKGPLASYFHS